MAEKEYATNTWFRENVVESVDDIRQIGENACRTLHSKLSMTMDAETVIAVYGKIFEVICDVLRSRREEWDEFVINIAGRFAIGFSSTENEEDEKQGNFMVFMKHLETPSSDDSLDEEETDTIALSVQWNAANIKEQAEVMKEISSKAMTTLSKILNLKVGSDEFIIPTFCIIHSEIIKFIRLKRVTENAADYEVNVAGYYVAGIHETDDAEEEVYFEPSVSLKRSFKGDLLASRDDANS